MDLGQFMPAGLALVIAPPFCLVSDLYSRIRRNVGLLFDLSKGDHDGSR